MKVTVTGGRDLVKFAFALKEAREHGLKKELDKASHEAGRVIEHAVHADTARYIPKHFEARWAQSMQSKTEVRLMQSRRITVVVWAKGKAARRDIEAINKGVLKHPIFGRINRFTGRPNPWPKPPQRIRPGVVTEPAAAAMPKAIKKIDEAVGRVAAKIGRAS